MAQIRFFWNSPLKSTEIGLPNSLSTAALEPFHIRPPFLSSERAVIIVNSIVTVTEVDTTVYG